MLIDISIFFNWRLFYVYFSKNVLFFYLPLVYFLSEKRREIHCIFRGFSKRRWPNGLGHYHRLFVMHRVR